MYERTVANLSAVCRRNLQKPADLYLLPCRWCNSCHCCGCGWRGGGHRGGRTSGGARYGGGRRRQAAAGCPRHSEGLGRRPDHPPPAPLLLIGGPLPLVAAPRHATRPPCMQHGRLAPAAATVAAAAAAAVAAVAATAVVTAAAVTIKGTVRPRAPVAAGYDDTVAGPRSRSPQRGECLAAHPRRLNAAASTARCPTCGGWHG